MKYQHIKFEITQSVAILTFNRPDSLNSFTADMHIEIREALTEAAHNKAVRCVLITGSGRGFCAGQDLSDLSMSQAEDAEMPDLGDAVEKNYNPLIRLITGMEKPVICAVNGVAAGAGANIALACDIVFAGRSASFIESFSKLGLIPDSGGTWILPRLVGMARAKGLAMLGPKIKAEQAEAWGMIWQCVDDSILMSTAFDLATHLATQPTRGFALTKKALAASAANTLDQQLNLERDFMQMAGKTKDYQEGVKAFLGKRTPEYRGE